MKIERYDSLEYIKKFPDYHFDINFSDPPYGLGSEIVIRPDGKPDYEKAADFMSKWDMPTGTYWESWFKEAFRTLKYGGYCIMFGMDRQLLLFKYYAHLAGFTEKQSMYWYFISNFPKATDLSKMIDKNAGVKGEIIGQSEGQGYTSQQEKNKEHGFREYKAGLPSEHADKNIYAPGHPLAKKYSGYKYSIAPLKQTNETIMIFQKPYKTGSCLHDTLAYENGDESISVGAMDIDGNRVGTENISVHNAPKGTFAGGEPDRGSDTESYREHSGRYPSQTFIDSQVAEVLDKQSGVSKSGTAIKHNSGGNNFGSDIPKPLADDIGYSDTGGCSKILHKCDFEKEEHDLYIYKSKVSKSERNAGCEEMEEKRYQHDGRKADVEMPANRQNSVAKNSHPTLKPISLNEKVLKLFKTPNEQKILYPFAGSGSEIIGGIKAGFTDWLACELSEEYVNIAEARINHWTRQDILNFAS